MLFPIPRIMTMDRVGPLILINYLTMLMMNGQQAVKVMKDREDHTMEPVHIPLSLMVLHTLENGFN